MPPPLHPHLPRAGLQSLIPAAGRTILASERPFSSTPPVLRHSSIAQSEFSPGNNELSHPADSGLRLYLILPRHHQAAVAAVAPHRGEGAPTRGSAAVGSLP